MANRPLQPSLNYSLDSLPKGLIGGYDRSATEQLFGRLNVSYQEMAADRARLESRVQELEDTLGQRAQAEDQTANELERLTKDLEESRQREQALGEQLDRARSDTEEQLDRAHGELQAELERARTELQAELEHARTELAAHERRENLVAELLESAKANAQRSRTEARIEAETTLKKARKREARIIQDAERKHQQLETESERLNALADKLRTDLAATLTNTLEQLKPEADQTSTARTKRKPAGRAGRAVNGHHPAANGADTTTVGQEVIERAISGAKPADASTAESAIADASPAKRA
jgi:chromosome segregation ATPase